MRLLMIEVEPISNADNGRNRRDRKVNGPAMKITMFSWERLAYNLGMISPASKITKVTTITWIIKPSVG